MNSCASCGVPLNINTPEPPALGIATEHYSMTLCQGCALRTDYRALGKSLMRRGETSSPSGVSGSVLDPHSPGRLHPFDQLFFEGATNRRHRLRRPYDWEVSSTAFDGLKPYILVARHPDTTKAGRCLVVHARPGVLEKLSDDHMHAFELRRSLGDLFDLAVCVGRIANLLSEADALSERRRLAAEPKVIYQRGFDMPLEMSESEARVKGLFISDGRAYDHPRSRVV